MRFFTGEVQPKGGIKRIEVIEDVRFFGTPDDLDTFRLIVGRPSTRAERAGVKVEYDYAGEQV